HYLAWKMKTLNYRTRMIELAGEVNSEMPRVVVSRVTDALNDIGLPVRGSRILVLGVAYERDIDEVRDSPALDIVRQLEDTSGVGVLHDPAGPALRQGDGVLQGAAPTADERGRAQRIILATDHSPVRYDGLIGIDTPAIDARNAMRGIESENIVGL